MFGDAQDSCADHWYNDIDMKFLCLKIKIIKYVPRDGMGMDILFGGSLAVVSMIVLYTPTLKIATCNL